MTPNGELSFARLRDQVQNALKHWQDNKAARALDYLHLFHQLQPTTGNNARATANQLLHHNLDRLEAEHAKRASVLRLRFCQGCTVLETAKQLNLEEPTIYGLQRDGIDHLARLIYQQELQARAAQYLQLEQRLEAPTYTQLIGVEAHLAHLAERLTTLGPPWLLVIEGMGGIGKTALAHALVRHLLHGVTFADVGWVTARQEHFDLGGGLRSLEQPALTAGALIDALLTQLQLTDAHLSTLPAAQKLALLQNRLKERTHLIVIDNLETVADLECLLPTLHQLADPTRFLLTSRRRLESEPGLYHFALPPLDEANALHLVRQEAVRHNLTHVADASDVELHPIYATVGGNPLALRLVVGQTHVHSLDLLLDDLVQARGQKVENLYTYLYRRAWDSLDEPARLTWLSLPLVTPESATLATLAEIVPITLPDLRQALETLARLSLVDCQGALNERRYTLHSLTRTFLQEQVARWQ